MNGSMPGIRLIEQTMEEIEKARTFLCAEPFPAFGLAPTDRELTQWTKLFKMQYAHSSQRYTIMLLGEFNAGKSTFLNALLDLPINKRLPTGDEPVNAVPIRLTRCNVGDPEIVWVFTDGHQESKTWADGIHAATQQGERVAGLEEVKAFIDHPLLSQADIMDMPGTGTAWYTEHTEITENYISNAELVIWVIGRDEPSQRGLKDYDLVKQADVPLIVLFNAWGYLDPEKDALLDDGDQDELEQSVRQNYPEPFERGQAFRVYAGKALEEFDRGSKDQKDFGMRRFRNYIEEKYLGEFLNQARNRRENVLRQTRRLARDMDLQLQKYLQLWQDELSHQGLERVSMRNKLGLHSISQSQTRGDIRRLAKARSHRICQHIVAQAETFLENEITIQNFQLWKKWLFKMATREQLGEELERKFRQGYLHLDDPRNWFKDEIRDFIEDAWVVLEAYWRTYLLQVAATLSTEREQIQPPTIPFDQFHTSAISGINDAVIKLLGLGGLAAILIQIPKGYTIDALVFGISVILASITDPFAKPRQAAVARFRQECGIQEDGLSLELLHYFMTEMNGKLEDEFQKQIDLQIGQLDEKSALLHTAIRTLDNLHLVLKFAADAHGIEAS